MPSDDTSGAVMIIRSVLIGMLVMLAGTMPRNLFFFANLRVFPAVPWAVPVTAAYIYFFWRFLNHGERRLGLRANLISGRVWFWALLAGGLAIVALVLALRLANRMVALPEQSAAALAGIPPLTALALLLMGAPVAGIIEEAAFRGYMQSPIEKSYGPAIAILISGTMFAVAHLDFTWILWPYYIAVAAIYGLVTYLTNSILPAIVLHTCGNIYSNLDLWLYGQAEWQTASGPAPLIWKTGPDPSFWNALIVLALVSASTIWAGARLARASEIKLRQT